MTAISKFHNINRFLKVCDESLTCLRPHEHGQLAAVANKKGSTYLLEFSEALTVNQKNDKLLLTAVNLDNNIQYLKILFCFILCLFYFYCIYYCYENHIFEKEKLAPECLLLYRINF